MLEDDIVELEDYYTVGVYKKRPVVIVRGSGAVVWDIEGREYIDCVAGHGVAIVGHCHPKVVEAIKKQAERLITCPGIFYNDVRAQLAQLIAEITPPGLEVCFFSNSGAEAIECAMKVARKYTGRKKFVAMMRGFHGRTMGALSLTWKPEYRRGFEPLLDDVVHIPFGNVEKAKEAIDGGTAAVFVEPVQGEGGINVAPPGYLRALRDICDEKGALLVFDEVQTGFGRTGRMFACEHWGVEPDIMCLAKGAAGGVPIGITVGRREIMSSLTPGSHGSTFGGNPLAMAAALAAINVIREERLCEQAREMGALLKNGLEKVVSESFLAREVKGLGLMIGVKLRRAVAGEIALQAVDKGVLLLTASRNVIRLLPPLVINREQVWKVVDALREVIVNYPG